MTRLDRGDQFKFNCGLHIGRLYTVIGFARNVSGVTYAVCQWDCRFSQAPQLQLFSEAEINGFEGAFQMWKNNPPNDADLFTQLATFRPETTKEQQ